MKDIYVTKASMPDFEDYVAEIEDIWDSHWLTNNGLKSQTLKKEISEFFGTKEDNISLLVNGHMALELLIQSMKLTGEVITTPYTFASTTHAIVRNNLTPVFCDVNEDDFTLDVTKIEELITAKTSAIIPVHVYGNVCDIEGIKKIADAYGLKVIYDAAHVFGTRYKGRSLNHFGDATMFSFHATKVFNTIEGGCACYKDERIGYYLKQLKNFGIQNPETVDGIGSNAKMNEFQAAMGLCNLRKVRQGISKREEIYQTYKELLRDVKGIRMNKIQSNVDSNYSYFPIVVDPREFGTTRNVLADYLIKNRIHPRKYFYPITSAFDCYHEKFDSFATPVALKLSKQVLTLPIYEDLTIKEVYRICQVIKKCQKEIKK